MVVSRRREYNAYRKFLESEVNKYKIGREAELREMEDKVADSYVV
jgi:hypothetical protein